MEEKITKILRENVNPILEKHSGATEFSAFEDGIVYVKMTGACGSCPSAQNTLENIIKTELMERLTEIKDVKIDMTVSEDLLDMARKILNKEIQ